MLDNKRGTTGHERDTIDEELTLRPGIQAAIQKIILEEYQGNRSEKNKWESSHHRIHDLLLKETKLKKKKEKKKLRN